MEGFQSEGGSTPYPHIALCAAVPMLISTRRTGRQSPHEPSRSQQDRLSDNYLNLCYPDGLRRRVTVACADGTLYAFDDLCIREASGWIGMTAERRYNRHYALRLHGPQRAELTMIIRWYMGVELGRSWETETITGQG